MKHQRADVLLAVYDLKEDAEVTLFKEADKLRKWKLTRKFRVFLEKTAPHQLDSPWGVWLRHVKESHK